MLCSLSDIRTYLKIEDSDPSTLSLTEEQWNMLILSSSAKISNICQRSFVAADRIEFLSGDNTTLLFTEQFPINSLTSITRIDSVDESNATEIDLDEVRIDNDLGELFRQTKWIKGNGNYKVSYNGGYVEGSIPSDLNLICVQDVLMEASKGSKDEALKSEKLGDYSYTNATPSEQNEILKGKLQKYINNFIFN